jgi:hypothetical protein
MIGGWRVLAGWGLLLCLFAAVQIIFTPSAMEIAPLGGAGVGLVLVGLADLVAERRRAHPRPEDAEPSALVTTSVPSLALAAGLGIFVLGWEVGTWMMAIGGGVLLLGIAGLVREHRAVRSR